jgi:hypothetical protein
MDALPFRSTARGLSHADVRAMLETQMGLARRDPAAALAHLDGTTFSKTAPGVDEREVRDWIDAQRTWLRDRAADPRHIDAALAALGSAMEDLRRAVEADARAAERRTADAVELAERRCAELIADAERRIARKAAQTRRAVRNEAASLRARALEDAERIVERAGSHAAKLLIAAEERDRASAEAAARAHELHAVLLNQIDAAQAAVSERSGRTAA